MNPPCYIVAIHCRCGNQIDIESPWHDYPEPQTYSCNECGLKYELTAQEKKK